MKNEKGQEAVAFAALLLLGLILAVMIWAMMQSNHAPQIMQDAARSVEQLIPLTNHAKNSHKNQSWNATTIQNYMYSGGCKPTIYQCPDDDFEVKYCQINDDKSIGLIIGLTVKQIVTGYMADTNHWTDRCTSQ